MHPNASCTISCRCRFFWLTATSSSKRRIAPIPSCSPPATTSTLSCKDSTASASTYRNRKLIRQLIRLQRSGHPHGEYIPPMDPQLSSREKALSDREIEGTLAGGTRQNQQGDSRKALHQYHHRDYPPQEYPGKTGYQERFFAHHLCR